MNLPNKISRNKIISALFLVAICLTPILWFIGRPGVLINGSDTNFPLDPRVWFLRRLFVWNAVPNAGENFSSSLAGLFFHLIQVIPYSVGISLQEVEIVSLVFWFFAIVMAAYIFARVIFPKNMVSQLIFVILYTFNVYVFNTWENVKVANLALLSALPLVSAVFLLFVRGKIPITKLIFFSAFIGVLSSGSGINPAYFGTVFVGLFIVVVSQVIFRRDREFLKKAASGFLFVLGTITLINSFWIVPTVNHLFFSSNRITNLSDIGFTNWINSLSENTSFSNVLRLQGAWDWYAMDDAGTPLYIPYALNYFRSLPFIVFSFLLTGLAFAGLIFRKREQARQHFCFAVMLVLGIFLGAGSHEPSGVIFNFLSAHLPFFSFFRSPWYIFTPLVTFAFAGLVGLLFEYLGDKLNRKVVLASAGIFIISNFLYTYPLITGKIFRPARSDGFYVNFPDYVFQAKKWLFGNDDGRIIGYPDDEIERFSWGYNSIESVLSLIVPNESVFSPLSNPVSPFALLTKEFYSDIKKQEVSAALSVAGKLNAAYLFDKNDQGSLAPTLPVGITGFPVKTFGQWNFYEFPKENSLPKIFSSSNIYFAYPFSGAAGMANILSGRDLLVNSNDSVVNRIEDINLAGGAIIESVNSQSDAVAKFFREPETISSRAVSRNVSRVDYIFDVPVGGVYQPVLERYQLKDFGLEESGGISGFLDSAEIKLTAEKENDSYVYLNPLNLAKGIHTLAINLSGPNLATRVSSRSLGDKYQDAAGAFEIFNFDPMQNYLISLNYSHVYSSFPSIPSIRVEQRTKTDPVKIKTENLPTFPETIPFSFYFEPVRTPSSALVIINAPHLLDPLGTRIFYSNIEIRKVFSNKLMLVKKANENILTHPKITFNKVSPVEYRGEAKEANGSHILVFSENYSPDWSITISDTQGSPVSAKPIHFTVNSYANGWYLEGMPENYHFRIYYEPQNLFYVGLALSLATFVAALCLFILGRIKHV